MRRKYDKRKCEGCGRAMKVAAKNQVRCALCALVKAAGWHDGRKSTCECGAKFVNWTGSMRSCGDCFIRRSPNGGRDSVEGTCGYHSQGTCHSGTEARLFDPDLKLCYPCLQDPEKFKPNRDAIVRRGKRLQKDRESGKVEVRA